MKLSLVIILKILVFNSYAKEFKAPNNFQIKKTLANIKDKNVVKTLREFVQCCSPSRVVYKSGNKKALQYLKTKIISLDSKYTDHLKEHEFKPNIKAAQKMYERDFNKLVNSRFTKDHKEYKKWRKFTDQMIKNLETIKDQTFSNLIWEKKGNTDQVLILYANIDNIVFNKKTGLMEIDATSQGANDNGSGITALLELIPIFLKFDLKHTIRLVFTNFQEVGFLGTHAYINDILKKEISSNDITLIGSVNLLMLGQDSEYTDKKKKLGNMKIYTRAKANGGEDDIKFAEKFLAVGKIINSYPRYEIFSNDFTLSENTVFWENKISSIVIGQDWENDHNHNAHHTSSDFVEALNIKTLTDNIQFIAGASLGLLFDFSPR